MNLFMWNLRRPSSLDIYQTVRKETERTERGRQGRREGGTGGEREREPKRFDKHFAWR